MFSLIGHILRMYYSKLGGPNHKISAGYSYNLYNILDPKDRKGSDFIHVKNPEDDSSITFQHLLNNVHNVGSDNYNLVELSNPEFNEDIQNSGYIVVEGDYELGYAYGLSGRVDSLEMAQRQIMNH